EKSDVDVDAFADELLKCWNPFRRAGNLDHHVLAGDRFPERPRFLDSTLRVAGQIWRDLQAHIAVATFGAFVYRPQNVGGVLNIAYGKNLVPRLGIEIGSRFQRVQQIGIIRSEERRVGKECRSRWSAEL